MIKAIIFDFGQTLVDSSDGFRRAEKEAQAAILQDISNTDHDAFKQHYRRIRNEFHLKSNLSRVKIWEAVYQEFSCGAPLEKLIKWEHLYWQTVESETKIFPEAPKVLAKLSASYNHLAIITNTQGQTNTQAHRFKNYPELAKLFSITVVAGENGVPPKPDTKAFKVCLKQLGIAAEEAVYVGDDWRNDIIGSKLSGLTPIWLKHHSVDRFYPEVKEDIHVITTLNELPHLLKKLESTFMNKGLCPNLGSRNEEVKYADKIE